MHPAEALSLIHIYVRASADSEGEVIGGFSAGTEVEKKGQEGDWIQVDYDGQTGYVYSGLLE